MGAPQGNQNARTHGAYAEPIDDQVNLSERIADLDRRIEYLSRYIDDCTIGNQDNQIPLDSYVRLVALHGALCSRLSRMLRDQQQLQGDDQTDLDQAIQEALDMAGDILGVKL